MTDHHGPQPTADEILDALDPEQRRVAKSVDGAVCVLAGAGTGKTRAITHRIAYGVRSGVMNPGQVLALTFTTKAAGELRSRLRTLEVGGVQARTFHSAALRQLRYFWPRAIGGEVPELIASKARPVAEAASRCRLSVSPAAVRDLAHGKPFTFGPARSVHLKGFGESVRACEVVWAALEAATS